MRLALVLAGSLAIGGLSGCGSFGKRGGENLGPDAPESTADVYVALAGEYYALGQLEVAQQRVNQALKEDANNPKAHMVSALIYQRLGEAGKAEEAFKRAAELAPKDGDIRNALGAFYCAQKRYPEAEEQFRQAADQPTLRHALGRPDQCRDLRQGCRRFGQGQGPTTARPWPAIRISARRCSPPWSWIWRRAMGVPPAPC